jgi:hypothetical protein
VTDLLLPAAPSPHSTPVNHCCILTFLPYPIAWPWLLLDCTCMPLVPAKNWVYSTCRLLSPEFGNLLNKVECMKICGLGWAVNDSTVNTCSAKQTSKTGFNFLRKFPSLRRGETTEQDVRRTTSGKGSDFGSCHGRNDDLNVRIRTSVRWNDGKSELKFDARSHVLAPACSVPSNHDYSCVLSNGPISWC